MTAGPTKNLTAMAIVAMEFPHAMILGCNAINKPVYKYKTYGQLSINYFINNINIIGKILFLIVKYDKNNNGK